MFGCILCVAISGFIGPMAFGLLVVESVPRRPQLADHVILRCHAAPARVYFRLNCQFEWDWRPKEPQPPTDGRQDSQPALPSPVASWWKVPNQDVSDTGSVIVINELTPGHQGRYVCQLVCVGRETESVALTLEIGEDSGQIINEQNSTIAFLATGAIFGLIILVTILRFFCVNSRECTWLSKDNNSDNSSSISILHGQIDSCQEGGLSSTETVLLKTSSDRRPTILDRNIWLPPYEAALKCPRVVRPTTAPTNVVCRPPTYEEALVCLLQVPSNNSGRIQTLL